MRKRNGDSATYTFTEDSITTVASLLADTNSGLKFIGNLANQADYIEQIDSTVTGPQGTDTLLGFYDSGTNDFEETFLYQPDQTQYITKIILNIPFYMWVSAYTSGNFALTKVTITITDTVTGKIIVNNSYSTGFSNMVNTGLQIAVLRTAIALPNKFQNNNPLSVKLSLKNGTTSGVGTVHFGYMPLMRDVISNLLTHYVDAFMGLQCIGTPDHNYVVLKDPSYVGYYDYSGVTQGQ